MTPDIVEERLNSHLEEAERRLRSEIRKVVADAASRGAISSSATVLAEVGVTDAALQAFVATCLLDRDSVVAGGGDEALFYETLATMVIQLKLRAGEIIVGKDQRIQGSTRAIFESSIEGALNLARLAVRHHQLGFGRDHSAAQIAVHGSSNVIVQAYSPGATATITMDAAAVRAALEFIEAAVPWSGLQHEIAADIRGELETIRAQLTKKSPSSVIVRESGRTLRSLAESLAATAAYPSVLSAVQTLWTAIGI